MSERTDTLARAAAWLERHAAWGAYCEQQYGPQHPSETADLITCLAARVETLEQALDDAAADSPEPPRGCERPDGTSDTNDVETIREAVVVLLDRSLGEHRDGDYMHEAALNASAAVDRLAARVEQADILEEWKALLIRNVAIARDICESPEQALDFIEGFVTGRIGMIVPPDMDDPAELAAAVELGRELAAKYGWATSPEARAALAEVPPAGSRTDTEMSE